MKILAIDDNESALKLLASSIAEVQPSAQIFGFNKPSDLLVFAKSNPCDIAFLDIKMWGMNGLVLAKELKDLNPKINIIFVTAYSKYSTEAFGLYPSGYILKPVTKEAVEKEIDNLRYPIDQKSSALLYVQTFGNFDVFSYGTALKFGYSKTKELLAYLVNRNGASVNMNELCAVLWEDKIDTDSLKAYLRKLISDLIKTLKKAGADSIVLKRYNSIAIIPEKITCDSYGFMKGDPVCVNNYAGEYMAQYSWAENSKWKFSNVLNGAK
ncbi:MAG: response regulator [Treponema sp.]|nr:response regulator [Treponema sp.]